MLVFAIRLRQIFYSLFAGAIVKWMKSSFNFHDSVSFCVQLFQYRLIYLLVADKADSFDLRRLVFSMFFFAFSFSASSFSGSFSALDPFSSLFRFLKWKRIELNEVWVTKLIDASYLRTIFNSASKSAFKLGLISGSNGMRGGIRCGGGGGGGGSCGGSDGVNVVAKFFEQTCDWQNFSTCELTPSNQIPHTLQTTKKFAIFSGVCLIFDKFWQISTDFDTLPCNGATLICSILFSRVLVYYCQLLRPTEINWNRNFTQW